ncbi:Nlrc5, partial [Symbiodinium sp. KB8]
DAGARSLATAISGLKKIQDMSLSLEMCDLGEEGAFSLLEALRAASPASTQLYLGESDIGKGAFALGRALRAGEVKGEVAHPVVEFLVKLPDKRLKELEEARKLALDLSSEAFEKFFAPLCRALPELPKLRGLFLWLDSHGGLFGDDGARDLAAGLGQQTELERLTLNLAWDNLGKEGAKAVASALARLTELKELKLNLDANKLGAAGATAVVESLRDLPQLTKLEVNLERNNLGNKEKEKLRAISDALPVRRKDIRLCLSLGALVVGFLPSASDLAPKKAEVTL